MKKICFLIGSLIALGGCSTYPPIEMVPYVDLKRFMGDWYVIANIPTSIEKGAHNAIESYQLNDDGSIATSFTFHKDSFNGEQRTYTPTGYVVDKESNAIWGMQFIWPIKADYQIVYLNQDYTQTIIGRVKRDYLWIMARTPSINEDDYQHLLKRIAEQGYDPSKVRKVPQRWE